jgi:hypothetical protein
MVYTELLAQCRPGTPLSTLQGPGPRQRTISLALC